MPNANHVTLMGHVTRDPQLRYTPGGTAVLELGLAINRTWSNPQGEKQESTTFVDVTFWGNPAETINKHISKGDPLYIEGRLDQDRWQDKDTGQNRQKLKVVAEKFQFLGTKGNGHGGTQSQAQQQPQAQQAEPEF